MYKSQLVTRGDVSLVD